MSITERASPRRQTREVRKPAYIARAKVGKGWVNIGAAWALKSGDDGFSIQLTTQPLNWDGRFILLPPLENEQGPEEPQD